MTIRHYKRQARLRAAANGTTHQAELNAIARENGHSAWGAFQAGLQHKEPPVDDVPVADDTPSRTTFRSVDDGMAIEMDWNVPIGNRDDDWKRIPFMPAFNVLGPKFLPVRGPERDDHVARVASIMMPASTRGDDYFDQKGRETLVGFLYLEIDRAERDRRTPSIPAMIDWINDGLRQASSKNELRKTRAIMDRDFDEVINVPDALREWLASMEAECLEFGYDAHGRNTSGQLAIMAPNERSGILGTMDKGLLPFKNVQVRRMNS